jgi:hypothetical protein
MDILLEVIKDCLNEPSNDFIVLLAALVFITWGITVAINRWTPSTSEIPITTDCLSNKRRLTPQYPSPLKQLLNAPPTRANLKAESGQDPVTGSDLCRFASRST